MSAIKFCKFHGFGNDYIVLDAERLPEHLDIAELARDICRRHTGAGSDGIAVIRRLTGDDSADFFCEIVNPDGSVAGFSGNGTRCAVAYLYQQGLWSSPVLRLATRSGIKNFRLVEDAGGGRYRFEAEIGRPRFASDEIPIRIDPPRDAVIDHDMPLTDRHVTVSCVNVGNPVACIFVDSLRLDWRSLGRELEQHPAFPERANIVFVKVLDRDTIELRIWERGAGETSASGTCASGAAVLSAYTGRTGRSVSVITEGGTTRVDWREVDGEMLLTGEAELAYLGEWPLRDARH
ncbi:MAG: diaminopimelate epimerase [Pyrinomonadaceae bacterium]